MYRVGDIVQTTKGKALVGAFTKEHVVTTRIANDILIFNWFKIEEIENVSTT